MDYQAYTSEPAMTRRVDAARTSPLQRSLRCAAALALFSASPIAAQAELVQLDGWNSSEVAVFQDEALAFDTVPPGPEVERRVLASYPAAPADVLLSGWMRGPEAIARKAAAVALRYGKGRVVLLGFRAQHRAQTPGTFPFLFNALYWSTAK